MEYSLIVTYSYSGIQKWLDFLLTLCPDPHLVSKWPTLAWEAVVQCDCAHCSPAELQ